MKFREGDRVHFYTSNRELSLVRRLLGYRYLYLEITTGDNERVAMGFIPYYKNYFNRPSAGTVEIIEWDFHEENGCQLYKYDTDEPIEYSLNRQQAHVLNDAYKYRTELVSSDEDWLYGLFPGRLHRHIYGSFYEQLLGLHC